MTPRRNDAALYAGLFLLVLAADWSFLSKAYVFEGLARAMPIDTGRWRALTPGHYVLYGPLGWLFHNLLAALGWTRTAVVSLQVLDGILGAAGAVVFASTLRRLGAPRPAVAAWTAALAAGYAWWLWSTDAQAYIFSALLLSLAFRLAVERLAGGRAAPWALGAALGACLGGHLVNGVFALPLGLCLWLTEPKRRRAPALAAFAASAALCGLLLYALALAVFVRPASVADVLQWLAGSAGVGGTRDVAWHGGLSYWSVKTWAATTFEVFTPLLPARLLVAGAALAAARGLKRASPLHVNAARLCAAWVAAYALVFTSWEPQTLVYRVPEAVPLTLLLFLGLRGALPGAALAAVLAAANFFSEILPRSRAEHNPALARMAFIKEATRPGDFVTGDGGQDELYIPYFAERPPLVLGRYSGAPASLEAQLKELRARGGRVVATSRALESAEWGPFFKRRKLSKLGEREGFALYLVLD